MYDLYEARNSKYCYDDSEVLVNKLNIKDQDKLFLYESKITIAKAFDLRQKGVIGNFDINHLLNIHKYLFEDIYPFAGKIRSENIAKDFFRFADWMFIEDELNSLLKKLEKENFLNGNSKEDLANRLAYYMAELNVLHPFREGNGRTIREFIRQLALHNGYLFNIKEVKPDELLKASIKSVVNTEDLSKLIYKCLEQEKKIEKSNDFKKALQVKIKKNNNSKIKKKNINKNNDNQLSK